jgi:thiol-disulfide isomerase/thioredoxin
MSSAGQARARTTRQKVAAQRAAANRAKRRKRLLFAGIGVSLVVVLALVLVVIRPGQSAAPAAAAPGTAAQAAAVTGAVASVPAATFDSVGAGSATGLTATSGQPLLTSDGKPEVLYMGGEFCPYCAAERWALTTALSRFGTFSGLSLIHSSPTDVYPSTPTLSFYKSSYTSKYVAFTPVEWLGEADDANSQFGHVLLQNPTAAEAALFTKYGNGSIPFVDIGNQYLLPEAQYLPSALSGMSWSQVAAALRTPSSPVAKDIDGAANIITASVCKMTNGQPGAVCSSAGVTAAAGSLQSQ